MPYRNKVCWITGASSGIGKALALALAARGARLVLSARRAEDLQAVADACEGEAPFVAPLDVVDAAARDRVAGQILDRFGHVDVLFNNAGVAQRSTAIDTPLDVIRSIMELNFFAPVALAKAVLPSMAARRSGQIVLTSSIGAKFGAPMRSTYAASKHALHGWFEALRIEQQANGIGVSFLVIGSVQTDIIRHALTASGAAWGDTDAGHVNGMAPDLFAEAALAGVAQGDHEIFIGSDREEQLILLKRSDPDALTRQLAGLYAMPK